MRWFLFGTAQFARAQARDRATRRLSEVAASAGLVAEPLPPGISPEVWQGGWVVDPAVPLRIRYCYSTRSEQVAFQVDAEISAFAERRDDVDTTWEVLAVAD